MSCLVFLSLNLLYPHACTKQFQLNNDVKVIARPVFFFLKVNVILLHCVYLLIVLVLKLVRHTVPAHNWLFWLYFCCRRFWLGMSGVLRLNV